ncbi:DNA-processing protein DprA [Mycobacterium colombiense]|uniref:DNA-processing protein DprA n=2 Tax=Mycobacteriaceae TaxID=1762 RepID=A0A329LTW0_9MYCO|nr:DNA-processing protein DprA [Mycobacterium colombiense]
MTDPLSPNTEAILLLTAPLIAGKGEASPDLLSPGLYNRLARHLQGLKLEPADLTGQDGPKIVRSCAQVVEVARLERLLGRGFLMAQAVERWHARAIWVVSRADHKYPRRLKSRLKADAPAVLYGCGDISSLDAGGLAVVGSRHVDDALIQYTQAVGALAAHSHCAIVSGGAKGIDQAAMRGALDAGGRATGVLADGLEKAVVNRYNRDMLLAGQLILTSPYDPASGFNVGNAMRRNKFVYALSDASLVVSSDLNKGGTWAGAVEQLDKLKLVTVFVRSTGPQSAGLDALADKGAHPWPNPQNTDELESVLRKTPTSVERTQPGLPFSTADADPSLASSEEAEEIPIALDATSSARGDTTAVSVESGSPPESSRRQTKCDDNRTARLADQLLETVRDVVRTLLQSPMSVEDVAAALDVSNSQVDVWLRRLLAEGVIELCSGGEGFVAKCIEETPSL